MNTILRVVFQAEEVKDQKRSVGVGVLLGWLVLLVWFGVWSARCMCVRLYD